VMSWLVAETRRVPADPGIGGDFIPGMGAALNGLPQIEDPGVW
jgi:hypothetical protein